MWQQTTCNKILCTDKSKVSCKQTSQSLCDDGHRTGLLYSCFNFNFELADEYRTLHCIYLPWKL
jgi:hypothetical protein